MHLNIIISMFRITLLLFVLTSWINCLRPVYGPVSTGLTSFPYQVKATQDHRLIVATFGTLFETEIYQNTGYGYQVQQTLSGTLGARELFVTNSGDYVYLYNRDAGIIMIFKQEGTFSLFQQIPTLDICSCLSGSEDGEHLLASFGIGKFIIYKLGSTYSEVQTIHEASSVRSIAINEQKTIIAASGFDALLRIY